MPERVEVEDVQWTPSLSEEQSKRLLLLLFQPLASKDTRRPLHTGGSQRERDDGSHPNGNARRGPGGPQHSQEDERDSGERSRGGA
jgi:hypothetical protein